MQFSVLAPLTMTVFDDVATAAGGLLGGDKVIGGWLLGLALIVALFITLLWAGGEKGFLAGLGIGIGFAVLVAWWPLWTGFFVIVVVVFGWWIRPEGAQGPG